MTAATAARMDVLSALGASDVVRNELLAYNHNHFAAGGPASNAFPLEDEPFVAVWEEYAREVERARNLTVLSRHLVQLGFPIEAGMRTNPDYAAATRRGIVKHTRSTAPPLSGAIRLYATPAGRIPAIIADTRQDFVTLVRAFTARNEPVHVPDSMGACVVAGYNNWDSIRRLGRIPENRALYQNTFLILSSGPYSATPAEALGLKGSEWLCRSIAVRAEHEAAHYFTRRVLGSMQCALGDELAADFYAIVRVFGDFRAQTLLQFLGLESFPIYRWGGRLENYRGNPPLSEAAFEMLQRLVYQAAQNLEDFSGLTKLDVSSAPSCAALLSAVCRFTVEELASSAAPELLSTAFRHFQQSFVVSSYERRGESV